MLFLAGYAAMWMVLGGVLLAIDLAAKLFAPQSYLPAAGVALMALAWQFSPIKQRCLNRCHVQRELAAFGAPADLDALRFGMTHGSWCAGSCWALMLFPMLLPRGHFVAMATVALLIFGERLEEPKPPCWRWCGLGKAMRILVAHARIRLLIRRSFCGAQGRFKPDVVAPGTSILSTRSRAVSSVPTIFGTSSDSAFFFDDGTSMATPLAAGCWAVLRECLIKNGTTIPSAALIKALLINGAVQLAGQYSPTEAGPSPNNASGWGRINLAGSVIIPGPNPNGGFGDGGPLKQGQESTVVIKVPTGQKGLKAAKGKKAAKSSAALGIGLQGISPTLKVTLVWSDPPGATLQNDLDLIVTAANGQERHGNMGTSKGFDRVNNVEQIVWENIPPGDVKITVRAFRITQFPQAYAYAWRIS
jgi:hypothetical protein